MRVYCTLFDSVYLTRGLALYESLRRHTSDFRLYIFAFDDQSLEILTRINLSGVIVIGLSEFETKDLLAVKKVRSRAEYCWTCTPSVIWHVLNNYQIDECTYLDSDIYFYSDPENLILELERFHKNVLITEHRYSLLPRLYEEKRAGRFCVQFMTFRREEDSLKVLNKWRIQCIDWCYARHEDGKFGDQKYLDEWPYVYNNIHILQNPGGGIAPWNIGNYKFCFEKGKLQIKDRRSGIVSDVIFFHFQYVKFIDNGLYDIGWYNIPSEVKKLCYGPYLRQLEKLEKMLGRSEVLKKRYNITNGLMKFMAKRVLRYNIITI